MELDISLLEKALDPDFDAQDTLLVELLHAYPSKKQRTVGLYGHLTDQLDKAMQNSDESTTSLVLIEL